MSCPDLEALRRNGLIRWIDIHFARLMHRLGRKDGEDAEAVRLAAALASAATRRGHICLDLEAWAGKEIIDEESGSRVLLTCPDPPTWSACLQRSPVIGRPGQYRPLILDDKKRLYLYRYWDYERRLIDWVLGPGSGELHRDPNLLKKGIQSLFPASDANAIDWQMVAALAASTRRFCVVSGGPGTGKTTTVARILALAVFLGTDADPLRIALAAPTGKAASRLEESIKNVFRHLPLDEALKERIPRQASTIHRLLGSRRHSPYFRHDQDHPLAADLVVIDEASMVDLALMAKLVVALPAHARLLLLGDKDQLASVEAGAVLGDICGSSNLAAFTPGFCERCRAVTGVAPISPAAETSPLVDSLVELNRNYRFGEDSGIGGASRAVRRGEAERALHLFAEQGSTDLTWHPLPAPREFARDLQRACRDALEAYLEAVDLETLFAAFSNHRVLCAVRRGPYGVETVNALIDHYVRRRLGISRAARWYPRKPVLITRNDYGLGLYNGDVGIAFPDPAANGSIRVYFQEPDGHWRKIHPHRLPEHELVWAMTVHKSQGSEFGDVHLVLPERDSPLLTRELLYTGITRARRRVSLWASEAVFRNAVLRRIERSSGLRDALWR